MVYGHQGKIKSEETGAQSEDAGSGEVLYLQPLLNQTDIEPPYPRTPVQ